MDWVTTFPLHLFLGGFLEYRQTPLKPARVEIGSDVWIGEGATIMNNVTVGHGACIGARAVVGSDVAPYAIVVGNPARQVRKRFTEDQIAALLRIAWWDWPTEKIQDAMPLMPAPEISRFIEAYDKG